jgi:hypothetical protein
VVRIQPMLQGRRLRGGDDATQRFGVTQACPWRRRAPFVLCEQSKRAHVPPERGESVNHRACSGRIKKVRNNDDITSRRERAQVVRRGGQRRLSIGLSAREDVVRSTRCICAAGQPVPLERRATREAQQHPSGLAEPRVDERCRDTLSQGEAARLAETHALRGV